MKNLLLGLALISGMTTFAQGVKPSASYTSNASSAVMQYRDKQLENAKIFVDAAYEQMQAKEKEGEVIKSKNSEKIYTYRGMIYYDLSNEQEGEAKFEYIEIATEMLSKERSISSPGSDNYNKATRYMKMISNKYYNLCGDMYGEQKYSEALKMAEKSIATREALGETFQDGYYNAALSASMAEEHEKAIKYFDILIDDKKYGDEKSRPLLYSKKTYAQKQLGLNDEAFATIQAGRKEFPSDRDLFTAEVDYYLQTGRTQEAFDNIDKLIDAEPENALYRALKGDLYGELANHKKDGKQKAEMYLKGIESYNKAIKINADYLHAYFNAGVYYINLANEVGKERNELGIKELDKDKELKAKEDDYYAEAVKMFEACTTINPEDPAAYDALRKIYFNLGEMEKSDEMQKKIDELKAKQ